MVCQMFANALARCCDNDPMCRQKGRIPNPGQFKYLRRLDGAGRQNNFKTGVCRVRLPAPGKLNRSRPWRMSPDIIKDNVCNMRTGNDPQIALQPRQV